MPSGKLTQNYGKSQFSMGKSTISMAIFNSFLLVYQRVNEHHVPFAIACPHRFCMEKQADKSPDNRSQECLRHDLGASLFWWETGSKTVTSSAVVCVSPTISVQQNWLIMGCATMKTMEKTCVVQKLSAGCSIESPSYWWLKWANVPIPPMVAPSEDLEVSRGFWENQSLEFSGAKPAICIVLE